MRGKEKVHVDPDKALRAFFQGEVERLQDANITAPPRTQPRAMPHRFLHHAGGWGVRLLAAAALAAAVSMPLWYNGEHNAGVQMATRYYEKTDAGHKIEAALVNIQKFLKTNVYSR